jgi:6-phospho-3-hexuloisomerase
MTASDSVSYILKHVGDVLSHDYGSDMEELISQIIGSKKIFIYGVGRSGLVGKAFAIRLVQLGLKVFFIGETITPIVEEDDLVIIISNTGETMSAIQTANIARRVGARVIVITATENSKLAHAGSIVICLRPERDESRESLAPLGTLFEVSSLLFLDGAVAHIMNKLNQKEDDMRKRHAIWV